MRIRKFKYIDVSGVNELNKCDIHFWSYLEVEATKCSQPVLKVIEQEENDFLLLPGFKTLPEENFYPCPLHTKYVILNKILYSYHAPRSNSSTVKVTVFSKDFSSSRVLNFTISKYSCSLSALANIINTLNLYIDEGRAIENLNKKLLAKSPRLITAKEALDYINNLKFEYFSNSETRVRRDNRFWEEVEITNLPSNIYWVNLFCKIIRNSDVVRDAIIVNAGILLRYDFDLAWAASYSREKASYDKRKTCEIVDLLKYNLASKFNPTQELNDRLDS